MNEQSKLYRELSHSELISVMASVFPEEQVTQYHLLSGGLFNTTYRVVTDRHDVVLRMGPVHRELLLPYEHTLMAAETLTDRLCLENGIPTSVVLHLDTSKTVIDRDFMVVDRFDAIPLSDPSIPPEKRNDILYECGKLARKLHTITGPQFGRLAKLVNGKGYSNWYDAILSEFEDILSRGNEYQVFDKPFQNRVRALVRSCKDALDAVTEPRLAHCDLWAGNILVQKTGNAYQVCAIIDGDRAMFGDVDLDLATPWVVTPEFLAGYGTNTASTPDADARKKVYALLFALHDAYVWKVEFRRDDYFAHNLHTAEEILNA